jgi:hypothetical protein
MTKIARMTEAAAPYRAGAMVFFPVLLDVLIPLE